MLRAGDQPSSQKPRNLQPGADVQLGFVARAEGSAVVTVADHQELSWYRSWSLLDFWKGFVGMNILERAY